MEYTFAQPIALRAPEEETIYRFSDPIQLKAPTQEDRNHTTTTTQGIPNLMKMDIQAPHRTQENPKPTLGRRRNRTMVINTNKRDWTIPTTYAPTLILGDSNLRNIRETTKEMQTVAYPGMTLETLLSTVSRSKIQRQTEKVVISVGINNREKAPTSPTFRALFKALDRVFPEARLHFLEININQDNAPKQKATVELLNYRLQQTRFRIIPKLPTERFFTTGDRVHWTQQTAEDILGQITKHI
jgi:hypothetical protein